MRAAARLLGLPAEAAEGGLTPEAKAARVAALDRHDTLMVGDGLERQPRLRRRLVHRHAGGGPAGAAGQGRLLLPRATAWRRCGGRSWAARRLRVVTRDNLLFSALYNLAAVALCFAGVVTPLAAAVLMPLSSVTVVGVTTWRLSGRRLAWIS